jgi:hypothetical protein
MDDVDRYQAAAERGLDRLDDLAVEDDDAPEEAGSSDGRVPVDGGVGRSVDTDEYGVHVDDPDVDLLDDDLDAGLRDDREADLLDSLAEVFNARDLEGMLELLAPDAEVSGLAAHDRDDVADAVRDLWRRRPTCCLTRGFALAEHVGVLWEHDGEAWWRIAAVHIDDPAESHLGVLEFSDDPALLDQIECEPPDPDDLEEGARWSEWEEGTDGT